MDDRTANLFAEFLQVRGHGVPQPPSVPPTDPFRMSLLIRDLKKLEVKPFEGKVDHMKADRWIRNLENYFKILGFLALFYKKYFPATVKEELQVEFLNLTQGSLTVREYKARFAELSRFADTLSELQQT
ncbi:hypothetical protein L3X38_025219 [Prunus dulcis]|uniref:Retrotransposon gag domain-containing protein n=1 Tax=Prunus dulcis TaxID=3755 RepID=A0AAD4W3U3_PRUDU|nr:hypothetical protein L3X38_025219 [Prunus dulcis]